MLEKGIIESLKNHYDLKTNEEVKDKIKLILQDAMKSDIPESIRNHVALDTFLTTEEVKTFSQSFLSHEEYWMVNSHGFQCNGPILQVFQNLGEILTELSNSGTYFYFLDPDKIYLCGNCISFPWKDLSNYTTQETKLLDREFFKKAPYSVAKPLRRGSITHQDLDPYLATYTLAYLLYHSLTPPHLTIQGDRDFMAYLSYLNTCNEKIPLGLKDLLISIITGEERGFSPLAFTKRVKVFFSNDRQKEVPFQLLKLEVDHYRQLGMTKEQQEDQSFVLGKGTSAFLMVADGVSTAHIGSGRIASTTAVDCLEEQKNSMIKELGQLENLSKSSLKEWQKKASFFLESIFNRIQHALIERLNTIKGNKVFKPDEQMMTTTLNLAVLTGNWVMVAWMGDSPAFIFFNNRLLKLIEPHNQSRESVQSVVLHKEKVITREDNEKALTRYLPYGVCHNNEKRLFEGGDPKGFISKQYFHLKPGDLFIMGSDGIVDCLQGFDNKEREKKLEQILIKTSTKVKSVRNLTYEVTKRIVEENGFDNVSMVVARISQHQGGKKDGRRSHS